MVDVKEAIVRFQCVERVKSELIIASKLIDKVKGMKEEEVVGARKLLLSFLDALLGEIRIAHNVCGMKNFLHASEKVEEAARNVEHQEYSRALRCVSEAISHTTTSGQQAAQILKEKGFI